MGRRNKGGTEGGSSKIRRKNLRRAYQSAKRGRGRKKKREASSRTSDTLKVEVTEGE